ncbi:MAG: hypothetical protein H0U98_14940 [Alphaproteobacteria bacterium]|nr:hypothetical protein [Alphaproteobacteria bacterium]
MAAKKKKKAKKAVKAKKAPAKKAKKVAKKATKKTKKSPAKKTVKAAAKKAPAKKAKKTAPKKKQIVGEGDYAASAKFDKDQASFVAKNKAAIPAMGKDAEKALDGPEGDALREAEATAAARSRDNF